MLIPLFLLVILGVDWASGYAIAGYVMRHGVGPYGYAFWQSIGPLCFLLIIQVVRRDLLPARGSFTYSLGCGLFGLAIPNLLIYISSRYVNSGILTIIANTASIFIYPLAILFRQEQYQLSRLLLVLIGSLGIFLLVRPLEFSLEMAFLSLRHSNSWLYLALLIPLCYAFTAVYIARFRPSSGNILNYSLWMLVVSSTFVVPLSIAQHDFYSLRLTDFNSWLIMLEVFLSTLGYILLFTLIKMVGPVYYSLVNAIAAIAGVFYGRVIFGQNYSQLTYIAITIIVFTIIGLTYLQTRKI